MQGFQTNPQEYEIKEIKRRENIKQNRKEEQALKKNKWNEKRFTVKLCCTFEIYILRNRDYNFGMPKHTKDCRVLRLKQEMHFLGETQ